MNSGNWLLRFVMSIAWQSLTASSMVVGAAGGAVTIPDGAQVFNSTGLTNINYAFNIAGNGWAESTAGAPFGAAICSTINVGD